jgi:hypothetical protein
MKQLLKLIAFVLIVVAVVLISCNKELRCYTCNQNNPPIANAGRDTILVLPKDSTILDGNASTDPDGTIVSYKWIKIAGPISSNIARPDSAKTLVKTLVAGVYQFELTVTDNGGLSAKDTVHILVDNPAVNQRPVACAGLDQTITLPVNAVNLNGSCSSDPENNITSYLWTKISGPLTFNITNASVVQTQVTGLVQGTYAFELKVTDSGRLSSSDTVNITVNAAMLNYNCDETNRPHVNVQLLPLGTLSPLNFFTAASTSNKLLFAMTDSSMVSGSYSALSIDMYDVLTKTWSKTQLTNWLRRDGMAVASAGNKIFFAGGETGDSPANLYADVDIYDVSKNTWSRALLSEPKSLAAGAALGNKVFFAGGIIDGWYGDATARVEVYDITSDTWSRTNVSDDRSSMTALAYNNKIYFAGGVLDRGFSLSDKIDIYDNATNSWAKSTLSERKVNLGGIGANNNIYWAGGSTQPGTTCTVEIKATNSQISSFTNLSRPGLVSAVSRGNQILFFGNRNGECDIYDAVTGNWSIGVLPAGVSVASTISLNNIIYVVGWVDAVKSWRVYQLGS